MSQDLFRHIGHASAGVALLLALAACGGDGGSPSQPATDSGAVTKAGTEAAAAQGAQTAQSTQTAQGTPAGQGTQATQDTTSGQAAAATQEPETMTEPIDEQAVRGDVLATALTQSASASAAVDGKAGPIRLRPGTEKWPNKPPYGAPVVLYEQAVQPADAGSPAGPFVNNVLSKADMSETDTSEKGIRPFDTLRVSYGLSKGEVSAAELAGAAVDAEVLQINPWAVAERQEMAKDLKTLGAPDTVELNGKEAYVIKRNARVKRDTRLMAWRGSDADVTLNIKGLEETQFSRQLDICLKTDGWDLNLEDCYGGALGCRTQNVSRESCTRWEVPQDWQLGQPLKFVRQSMRTYYDVVGWDGHDYSVRVRSSDWFSHFLEENGPAANDQSQASQGADATAGQ